MNFQFSNILSGWNESEGAGPREAYKEAGPAAAAQRSADGPGSGPGPGRQISRQVRNSCKDSETREEEEAADRRSGRCRAATTYVLVSELRNLRVVTSLILFASHWAADQHLTFSAVDLANGFIR